MIKKIGMWLGVILVVFLGYVAIQPADYVVSREITINASPEKIFPYLNTSKLANEWGPWFKMDPKAKAVVTGPEAGVGSKTSWSGGDKLGTGSASIVGSVPNERVDIKLDYTEPYEMHQDTGYLIKPAGAQSTVVWAVRGKNNFMGRLMCTFMNMDKMVGGMFEQGLADLKKMVEQQQ